MIIITIITIKIYRCVRRCNPARSYKNLGYVKLIKGFEQKARFEHKFESNLENVSRQGINKLDFSFEEIEKIKS